MMMGMIGMRVGTKKGQELMADAEVDRMREKAPFGTQESQTNEKTKGKGREKK